MPTKCKIILLGHDCFRAGSQMLLLNIGIVFKNMKVDIHYVLLDKGSLLSQYESIAPVTVMNDLKDIENLLYKLKQDGFQTVLSNTVVTGHAVKIFKKAGFYVCSLIHELPSVIVPRLVDHYKQIRDYSDVVIFPNNYVIREVEKCCGTTKNEYLIRSQGIYKSITLDPNARSLVRKALNLKNDDRIVINVGYGYARKGLDLFLKTASTVSKEKNIHFMWLGDVDKRYFENLPEKNIPNFHLIPFTENVELYLNASDLFFLSSREDPFPSVVLEALMAGLPVLSFNSGGGYVELLQDPKLGRTCEYLDLKSANDEILKILNDPYQRTDEIRTYRRKFIIDNYDFQDYCYHLLGILKSGNMKRISVITPNYNYSRYLNIRLDSIYSQKYPLSEVIILDDKSTDNSVNVLQNYMTEKDCYFKLIVNDLNYGSAYLQWYKGAIQSKGDYIWIAEADDSASPDLIKDAIELLDTGQDIGFVFCDSSQIDENNKVIGASYRSYMETVIDAKSKAFIQHENFVMSGTEFVAKYLSIKNIILNVSSVLWRRDTLLRILELTKSDHANLKIACDWKMYVLAALTDKVGYVAKPNNVHRRHLTSVVHSSNSSRHFEEITIIQDFIASRLNLGKDILEKQQQYRQQLKKHFNL